MTADEHDEMVRDFYVDAVALFPLELWVQDMLIHMLSLCGTDAFIPSAEQIIATAWGLA